jgi:hypothetical protein
MNASKLNDVTLKTGTTRLAIREGKMRTSDLDALVRPYGMITEWQQDRGRRYSLMSSGSQDSWKIKVALLCPPGVWADNREVRQELYLQAESIIEVMKQSVQLISPPRIVLGGVEGQIEGTMEVVFSMLWGVGPEWLYGTALLMRRRLKRRS